MEHPVEISELLSHAAWLQRLANQLVRGTSEGACDLVQRSGWPLCARHPPGIDRRVPWQLYARGERHITSEVDGSRVNQSRPAPPGTPAWPGYPFTGTINGHSLPSSYKGYVNMDG